MIALNSITSFNLIVFFCLLYFRKNNVLPNKILALLLLDPAINFISNINTLAGNLPAYPFIYFTAQLTGFFFAPLVYMYVLLMTGKKIPRWHIAYLGTAVGVLFTAYSGVAFYQLSAEKQSAYLLGVLNGPYPDDMEIVSAIFIILQQVYFSLAAIQVYRYRKTISNSLSNYEQTQIKFVTLFIVLIWALNFMTIGLYGSLPIVDVEYIYLPVALTAIYSFILYFSFHYHSVFTTTSYKNFKDNTPDLDASSDKPAITQNDTKELEAVVHSIEQYFKTNELFTDPELTIAMLSAHVKIPVKKISLSINKLLDKNFYDYINEKRISKSVDLLKQHGNYTVEAIAFDSGFNSRSAFYRAFKKVTGKTPVIYLGEQAVSISENG